MNTPRMLSLAVLTACVSLVQPSTSHTSASPNIELKRVPEGGIQPQIAADRDGTIHLVYFKGDPAEGDLFYARSNDGITFSDSIRVNSVPGTAVALGNIRGARIAVGRKGNVYVVWNGSQKLGNPSEGRSPMLFSRLNESRTAFEPERNLIHTAYGLDGGGGIAADGEGRVYVFWHAPAPGEHGEEARRVWITRSEDDGNSFLPETMAWNKPTGACGCCSLNASADVAGRLYVLFRSAEATVHRNMYLLQSTDHGMTFRGSDISDWNVGACVMSSEAFASGPGGMFAAWETEKQVRVGSINPHNVTVDEAPISPDGANQKYPALALNREGVLLVAWTEGMGWKRGGSVHWKLVDTAGSHDGPSGGADGVPAFSLVAAYARRNNNFVVIY